MARKGSENVIAYGNYFEYQGVKNFTLVTRHFCHPSRYIIFVTSDLTIFLSPHPKNFRPSLFTLRSFKFSEFSVQSQFTLPFTRAEKYAIPKILSEKPTIIIR